MFFEICANPIYYEKLLHYNLTEKITVEIALNTARNLSIYSVEKQSHDLFKVGFEVGGRLLNRVWLPHTEIQNITNYYLNNYFKNNYVIGIQFRTEILNLFKNKFEVSKQVKALVDCAMEIEEQVRSNINGKEFKWFILSDSQELIEELVKKYSKSKLIVADIGGQIGHVKHNTNAYARAIVDNELLSKCDQVII